MAKQNVINLETGFGWLSSFLYPTPSEQIVEYRPKQWVSIVWLEVEYCVLIVSFKLDPR